MVNRFFLKNYHYKKIIFFYLKMSFFLFLSLFLLFCLLILHRSCNNQLCKIYFIFTFQYLIHIKKIKEFIFLDAFSHLYKRVRPSVRRSVRASVTHELKPCKSTVFDQNYYQYQRERILWPCIRPCLFENRAPKK